MGLVVHIYFFHLVFLLQWRFYCLWNQYVHMIFAYNNFIVEIWVIGRWKQASWHAICREPSLRRSHFFCPQDLLQIYHLQFWFYLSWNPCIWFHLFHRIWKLSKEYNQLPETTEYEMVAAHRYLFLPELHFLSILLLMHYQLLPELSLD